MYRKQSHAWLVYLHEKALATERSFLNRPLKNVASAAEARKNEAKKRSLHVVNEHFGVSQARLPEPLFKTASADSERRETFERSSFSTGC
jgi:hypothetical protein